MDANCVIDFYHLYYLSTNITY